MSRKHYEAIAEVLAAERAISGTALGRIAVVNITHSLADVFKRDNPSFDRERFYKAVGL